MGVASKEIFQPLEKSVANKHSKDPNVLVTRDALVTESHHEEPLKGSKGEKYNR